ncbi:efflux RND transporter periplasmic adaptor subunit [Coraliomargarita sp. SDUM461004]|uniref:Efflux RND transporter periplasmic adaptor subunit n=1 Tax=Thalassobacterium sedimentorum TaxID=3041258 RepID=A0ABU1AE88_9BACT|nr:efflux RND transporter periplasmic adaptor subunit [Coraliomargarita sp. SDUM461004]MDQ8193062.1 efflux RND transporter periplasmic adaptor subunit [Coraliomargarita sp. SDUM461004]
MKKHTDSFKNGLKASLALLALTLVSACSQDDDAPNTTSNTAPQTMPVKVQTVQTESVTLHRELPGRTAPFRVAQVRARVSGIIEKRLFEEGSEVAAGQLLFEIDPAPYQAQLDSAQANLARAKASYEASQSQAERFKKLVKTNAISQQNYDDARASALSLKAEIAAAQAAVDTAQINLDYTKVTAPINGRIGRAEVTEGAYVQQATATLLATIQQIDTLYVDLNESAEEILQLKTALESGQLDRNKEGQTEVQILLNDGSVLPQTGSLQFSDITVNTSTGTVMLRATVPNPDSNLLPGMFVRARITEGTDPNAILVPQSLVSRNNRGEPVVILVNDENIIEQRTITTSRTVGDAWLVSSGLQAGERLLINNRQKVRPGMSVQIVPTEATSAATPDNK